ncbi:MAG: hypothetical protein RDU20_15315 [Desulfomonilaceae bacterium]|nr:hypothetical protein [Desulfomonilaceae bacterium]
MRNVQVPPTYREGPVAVCLEAAILEHCLPDGRDIRLVSSDGSTVPITITPPVDGRDAEPIPVRVYRVARKAGKWTDIWVDKAAKVLTRGVQIRTRSSDFVRKVELRGADTSQEAYVIRVDGLIVDRNSPIPIRSHEVFHPLNNFQYLQIRIMDGDAPPLKVDGVYCYPPLPEGTSERPLSHRIIENRFDKASAATIVVADLGAERLPVCNISVRTSARNFVKAVRVSGAYTSHAVSWSGLGQGTIFRIIRDHASAENLEIRLDPSPIRYLKLEFTGGPPPDFTVDGVTAFGSVQLLVFQPTLGSSYQLYYGNPRAQAEVHAPGPTSFNIAQMVDTAREMEVGPARPNIPQPSPKPVEQKKEVAPFALGKALGVIMLLVGLLLLFSVMLKARSLRRRRNRHSLRIPDASR